MMDSIPWLIKMVQNVRQILVFWVYFDKATDQVLCFVLLLLNYDETGKIHGSILHCLVPYQLSLQIRDFFLTE